MVNYNRTQTGSKVFYNFDESNVELYHEGLKMTLVQKDKKTGKGINWLTISKDLLRVLMIEGSILVKKEKKRSEKK